MLIKNKFYFLYATGFLIYITFVLFFPNQVKAQAWPQKTVRLIIPFTAGGTTDILGRVLAQQLSKVWDQNIIVENKAGASGNIAAQFVSNSSPDGYTLLLASGSMLTVNPTLYKKLPLNYEKDLIPITNVAGGPMLITVNSKVPVNNLNDLITLAKTKNLTFGSAGIGSQTHLASENFIFSANISATHIPYKGESAAVIDLASGQIDFMVLFISGASGFAKTGQINPLAIADVKRSKQLPNIPTATEAGLAGFQNVGWFGLVAPAGTPKSIVDIIQQSTVKALNTDAMRTSLEINGLDAIGNTPLEFSQQIKNESKNWAKIIQTRNLSAQ